MQRMLVVLPDTPHTYNPPSLSLLTTTLLAPQTLATGEGGIPDGEGWGVAM